MDIDQPAEECIFFVLLGEVLAEDDEDLAFGEAGVVESGRVEEDKFGAVGLGYCVALDLGGAW